VSFAPFTFVFSFTFAFSLAHPFPSPVSPPQTNLEDIDAFMEKVLERRETNWEDYRNYFCTERAELAVEGAIASVPIHGTVREYLWYVRDGYRVRSPVSVDGVEISPEEREKAELEWIEAIQKRELREAEREGEADGEGEGANRERFIGFEFEPGSYFYAGRRSFEGRELVVIEHYPEEAFGDHDDEEAEDERERELEAKLNKVFLVTLWIDPNAHQIVRMTLDNVGFEFLPAKWLVQLDTVEATLTMNQPFAPVADIWLARDIEALGRITTALGDLSLRYRSEFYGCVRAETETDFAFPRPARDLQKKTTKKKKEESEKR
jgi:hypothetical protein